MVKTSFLHDGGEVTLKGVIRIKQLSGLGGYLKRDLSTMASRLRPFGMRTWRSDSDPHRIHMSALSGCLLLTIGLLFVGVAGHPFRPPLELGSEQTTTHGRRLLAVNLTRSLGEDGEALLLIKAAITRDPLNITFWWKRQGSGKNLNPCKMRNFTASYWPGINCTNRRVSSINLADMNLSGTLSPHLGALSFLRSIDLSNNLFSGPIPDELTSAAGLVTLNFGNNRLDGAVPIGNWTNLTTLDVSNNRLAGQIPTSIGNLHFLTTLNMSNNNLTGAIPSEINLCTRLNRVDLSRNGLQGTVPFQNLSDLTVLHLQENQLDKLPASFGNWTNVTSLDVSNNGLVGAIPASIGNMQLLETLNVTNNNLTGPIPTQLNLCKRLNEVDLSKNGLQGTVPFQNLSDLTVLHLQENQLTGDFVSYLGTLPQLEDLDLSNNYLTGSIPSTISNLPLRTQLSLGRNNLTGTIPDTIGKLSILLKMNLSANAFTGKLTDNISSCVSLQELDVSTNYLTGLLPGIPLSTLANLEIFNVSTNEFGGGLPLFFDLKNLKVLDASFNDIEGPIPTHFVDYTTLTYLNVSYNRLIGEVPIFAEHDGVNFRSFDHNHVCGVTMNITCYHPNPGNHHSMIVSIAVGNAVAFVLLFIVIFLCCSRYFQQEKEQRKFSSVSAELELKLTPLAVLRATQNFNEENKIGQGSMGDVYRGVLQDHTSVAVKKLAVRIVSEGTEKVFVETFDILSHIRHWSLVKVIGYCCSTDVTALVMEYVPNGNLYNVMYPQPTDIQVVKAFNWHHRFNTAIGVAEGLNYLHHDCSIPTVHGDLKPSNILFNTFMEARITDFAVSKILRKHGVNGREVGASNRYKAPESVNQSACTIKSDVYSYGILLLEMMSALSPQILEEGVNLPDWIRTTLTDSKALENILDPVLRDELEANRQKMSMVLGVALLCTRQQPHERPYIAEVLKMLNHIKARPHDETKGSMRFKSSPSTHERNEEIRHEVPGIEITPSPPTTPGTPLTPPHALLVQNGLRKLPRNPSLSEWTLSPENR